ncbi:hypothetical protein TSUD_184060 [Trifolium subterraneum]|uniref:Uncharacterized protein n=1 Tax=Trifolium subterraneum TaxID=3900 RepID=A0A2Z6NXQ8_TRISU|nr:hypothetical protein TSUD_184060 [Trifolium subterraneum]
MASQPDADFPISSAPVVMLSPPDTQDGPQDVFHTPPEESLLPSSDVDLPPCTVNRAVDLDVGSQAFVEFPAGSDSSEFVDFGKDSQLGFSQDADSVSENRVLEKGVSDFSESSVKKLKLGFDDSLGSCSGVQSEKVEDGIGNGDEGKVENACKFVEDVLPQSNGVGGEDVEMQNLIPEENVETEVVENDGDNNSNNEIGEDVLPQSNGVGGEDVEMENSIPDENIETEVVENAGDVNGNNSNNEIGEGSGNCEDLSEEESDDETEYVMSAKESRDLVFDVFRVVAEHSRKVENETKGLTLLETAMRSGVTFPRPSWLPADRKSKLFKFDDEVKK